jgi:hypothetical protein
MVPRGRSCAIWQAGSTRSSGASSCSAASESRATHIGLRGDCRRCPLTRPRACGQGRRSC